MSTLRLPEILKYHAALAQRRELFLMRYPHEVQAFDAVDSNLAHWVTHAPALPEAKGRPFLTMQPLLGLMQRQLRDAFEALSEYQSGRAWIAVRPFLEAALVLGKWADDPRNATLWMERHAGRAARKEFQDAYTGEGLRSHALPLSDALRNVWGRLSDYFLESQHRFFTRPMNFGRSVAPFEILDEEADHQAHLYAILHLTALTVSSLNGMWSSSRQPEQPVNLLRLEHDFSVPVIKLSRASEQHKNVLLQLGLWPPKLLSAS